MASFLRDADQLKTLHETFIAKKADPSEKAAFQVDGVELLKSAELFAWWRQQCEHDRAAAENEQAVCLATGNFGAICRTTGFIKGLTEDTKLISCNKQCPAFESYGLEQAANAPISSAAEEKIRSALDELIQRSRDHRLEFNGTFYLHWTKEDVYDPTDLLVQPNPQEIANLLQSVERGSRYVVDNPSAYFAAAVCANGPRLVVRDWVESTIPIVSGNIARWFRDLRIIEPFGQGEKCEFSLWELMSTLVPKKDKIKPDWKKLPPQLATEVLFSAMRGNPDAPRGQSLPSTALVLALQRHLVEVRKPGDKLDPKLNPARLALIKACLIRSPNRKETDTMTEKLDPNSKDSAYRCGQLFAVIGRLQLLALGKVGASIAERTYGGVATRPATTFGPLFTQLPISFKKGQH